MGECRYGERVAYNREVEQSTSREDNLLLGAFFLSLLFLMAIGTKLGVEQRDNALILLLNKLSLRPSPAPPASRTFSLTEVVNDVSGGSLALKHHHDYIE